MASNQVLASILFQDEPGDALSSRRGAAHRRRVRLCCAAGPGARAEPGVSAFISADCMRILDLVPDVVLAFSDLQADVAADSIRRNVAVLAFNQGDIAGILDMIRTLGALVGARAKADELADGLEPAAATWQPRRRAA